MTDAHFFNIFYLFFIFQDKFGVRLSLCWGEGEGGARDLVDQLMEDRGAGQEGQGLPNANLR